MKYQLLSAATLLFLGASASLFASTVCPSTPSTTSDCDFLITIGTTGMATVSQVAGSTPFNSAIAGVADPGGDASLVGVIDDYTKTLTSLTLEGSGTNFAGPAGIFDFSFNGICNYSSATYCATAATGYEGPTTTFSSLNSTVPFETNVGTVNFMPALAEGQSTYFSIEDSAASIAAAGGLTVTGESFATPEPSELTLLGLGLSAIVFGRKKRFIFRRDH